MTSSVTTVRFRFHRVFEEIYRKCFTIIKWWIVCVNVIPLLMFEFIKLNI